MMRLGGRFNDQQIIPAEVVDDIRHGGNAVTSRWPPTRCSPGGAIAACGGCRTTNTGRSRLAGSTGQAVYVDPAAEMVIARFASHPVGANANLDPTSLPAYHAMAKYLMRG